MPSLVRTQMLSAAGGLFVAVSLLPVAVDSGTGQWVDRITQGLETARESADPGAGPGYERYRIQLQSVRAALTNGSLSDVRAEMSRLVRMAATKEGGLSESSARDLLSLIGEVTPAEYLDETTRSHLRLVRSKELLKPDILEDRPAEVGDRLTVAPRTAGSDWWNVSWLEQSTLHPVVTVGAGILVLVGVGVLVLLFVALRGPSKTDRSAVSARKPDGGKSK